MYVIFLYWNFYFGEIYKIWNLCNIAFFKPLSSSIDKQWRPILLSFSISSELCTYQEACPERLSFILANSDESSGFAKVTDNLSGQASW